VLNEFETPDLSAWESLTQKEAKVASSDALTWQTPEGIPLKALYTAADLEQLETVNTLPGIAPFQRGVRASMYANRAWTIRQYAGFSTAEASNAFYRKNLAAGQQGVPSISPPTAATTAITPVSPATWARPGSRSIRWKT
jgi:methylmalonyl-CoA mutase